jgi:hypothetical protein
MDESELLGTFKQVMIEMRRALEGEISQKMKLLSRVQSL